MDSITRTIMDNTIKLATKKIKGDKAKQRVAMRVANSFIKQLAKAYRISPDLIIIDMLYEQKVANWYT